MKSLKVKSASKETIKNKKKSLSRKEKFLFFSKFRGLKILIFWSAIFLVGLSLCYLRGSLVLFNFREWMPPVQKIFVHGANYTSKEAMRKTLKQAGCVAGAGMTDVDPWKIQQDVLSLPWVKKCFVRTDLLGKIQLNITEKIPIGVMADGCLDLEKQSNPSQKKRIWMKKKLTKSLTLVDESGETIQESRATVLLHHLKLIWVKGGKKAQAAFPVLYQLLRANPRVFREVEGAIYIHDRRWNLKTHGGSLVKLSAQQQGTALSKLNELLKENIALLSGHTIDLRFKGEILMQTHQNAEDV